MVNISEAIEVPGHGGGRNLVYRIGDKSVLRISTLSERTIEDYQAEIEYVHFLAEGGASVADTIPAKEGKRIEIINDMVVSVFEYAKGDQIAEHGYQYRDGADISEYFYNTGKTLGKIHALSKEYKPIQVDGYSLDAQKDKIRKYAEFQDMEIVGEYSDEGHSGKNINGRPEFMKMLNDIEDGKDDISFVLVHF